MCVWCLSFMLVCGFVCGVMCCSSLFMNVCVVGVGSFDYIVCMCCIGVFWMVI